MSGFQSKRTKGTLIDELRDGVTKATASFFRKKPTAVNSSIPIAIPASRGPIGTTPAREGMVPMGQSPVLPSSLTPPSLPNSLSRVSFSDRTSKVHIGSPPKNRGSQTMDSSDSRSSTPSPSPKPSPTLGPQSSSSQSKKPSKGEMITFLRTEIVHKITQMILRPFLDHQRSETHVSIRENKWFNLITEDRMDLRSQIDNIPRRVSNEIVIDILVGDVLVERWLWTPILNSEHEGSKPMHTPNIYMCLIILVRCLTSFLLLMPRRRWLRDDAQIPFRYHIGTSIPGNHYFDQEPSKFHFFSGQHESPRYSLDIFYRPQWNDIKNITPSPGKSPLGLQIIEDHVPVPSADTTVQQRLSLLTPPFIPEVRMEITPTIAPTYFRAEGVETKRIEGFAPSVQKYIGFPIPDNKDDSNDLDKTMPHLSLGEPLVKATNDLERTLSLRPSSDRTPRPGGTGVVRPREFSPEKRSSPLQVGRGAEPRLRVTFDPNLPSKKPSILPSIDEDADFSSGIGESDHEVQLGHFLKDLELWTAELHFLKRPPVKVNFKDIQKQLDGFRRTQKHLQTYLHV